MSENFTNVSTSGEVEHEIPSLDEPGSNRVTELPERTQAGSGGATSATPARARNVLHEIESSPALLLQLRLWQNEDELQLFGIFVVFEGVVLTALAQSSKLECGLWWIPFVLTIFAGMAVAFAVWYKLQQCEKIRHEINLEKANSRAVARTMERFLGLGADYDPNNLEHQPVMIPPARKTVVKWKISIVTATVAFTALIAAACKLILCKRK